MTRALYPLLFALAFLLALYLYMPSLDFYFFQDDFFEINISKAHSLREYLEFFRPRSDIIAYRPISLQNYFFISSNLFGASPIGFRLITFVLFFLSSFLIVKVIGKITKSVQVGFLTAIFWLLSSIHFMAISWIAAAYNIIGTFFWLLTSFIFIKFIESGKHWLYLLSIVSFFLTIGSYEFSVTWPAILGFYYLFVLKKPLTRGVKIFLPFILIALVYLAARLLFIKVPQIPEYVVTFNLDSLKAFFWYILWSFNIPEEFKKQIVDNLLSFNPIFLAEFWILVTITFIGMLWILVLGVALPIYQIIKKRIIVSSRFLAFGILWFTVAIFPVLFLPYHTFTMYLTLASIGIYLMIAYLVYASQKPWLAPVVFLIWIMTSITTLNFYKVNFWMIEAQKFAKEFAQNVKTQFPTLPKGSVVVYDVPYGWQKQALLDQNAIHAIYDDPTLTIYYNKQSMLSRLSSDNKEDLRPIYIYLPQ